MSHHETGYGCPTVLTRKFNFNGRPRCKALRVLKFPMPPRSAPSPLSRKGKDGRIERSDVRRWSCLLSAHLGIIFRTVYVYIDWRQCDPQHKRESACPSVLCIKNEIHREFSRPVTSRGVGLDEGWTGSSDFSMEIFQLIQKDLSRGET